MMKRALIIFIICFSALNTPSFASEKQALRICCKNVSAGKILPHIEKLLGENEGVTLDEKSNCLILRGKSEAMAQMASVIAMLDKASPTVHLRIRNFIWTVLESQKSPIEWKQNDGNWRVGDMSDIRKSDQVYRAPGKQVVVHSSADASEKNYRVRAGDTIQVPLGIRIKADQLRATSHFSTSFIFDLKTKDIQPALLITPSVNDNRVMLSIVPATLAFENGKMDVHRHETLTITASCPEKGEIFVGSGESNGNSLLSGWFKSFKGSGIELGEETGLLISVNVVR